ncbi:hypothetical protein D3C81_2324380 [compost metagenome]
MIQGIIVLSQQHLYANQLFQLNQIIHEPDQGNFEIERVLAILHHFAKKRVQGSRYQLLIPEPDGVEQL